MKTSTSLVTAFMLVLLPATSADAKQPLYSQEELDSNLSWLDIGPNDSVTSLVGTITIDSHQCDMVFFATQSLNRGD